MNYLYLDQNIIDRIDRGLDNELGIFLKKNNFIPAVSTASLHEIERGEQPERIIANIQSLVSIGARFIIETNSGLIISQLSADEVYELISSKDQRIANIAISLNKLHYYQISCTWNNELEEKIREETKEIESLIDILDERHEQTKKDLLDLVNLLNNLTKEGAPEEYNFIIDLRSKLAVNPREMNNLNHSELWKKIEELTRKNGRLLPFDLSKGNAKERLSNTLLMLNLLGYWCDDIDSDKRHLTFTYDCMHGIYGSLCYGVISSDKRFLKRLRAAYHYLSVPTKIYHLAWNIFNELN